jgi:hypothetical protein
MVLFFSLALMFIAVVLLVVGIFFQDGLTFVYASIVAVLASGAVLGTGVLLRKREAEAASAADKGPIGTADEGPARTPEEGPEPTADEGPGRTEPVAGVPDEGGPSPEAADTAER